MRTHLPHRALAALAVAGLAVAACGSDAAEESAEPSTTSAADSESSTASEPELDTAADDATEASDEDASAEADESSESTAEEATADEASEPADEGYPVTIEHKFGSSTIDAAPERIVSIGFNEHDFLLALDIVPVGLRDWYGEQPNGVWPWAQDELDGATPEVLSSGDLNFEQIAALNPDVIVGVWSGMTEQDYELLSEIAPVVAQPDTYEDYGTPWQEQTVILGRALGLESEAAQIVSEVEADIVAAREAHPEWEGLTSSVAFFFEDAPGAYTSEDTRSRFMQ
ncbi:MAG: ABC transporter substrate-binding protein, partial [Actinomycetota bacterium]